MTLNRPGPSRDQARSLAWSVAGHLALIGLILAGGIVIRQPPPMVELGIKASLVDPRTLARPAPPAPVAEPKPVEEPPPAPQPDPRQAEEERRKADAEQRRQEDEARQAEEKRQADQKRQVELRKQQEKAEAEKKAAEKKAAEEKAAAEKKEAERRRKEEEAKAASAQRRQQEAADLRRQMAEEESLQKATDSGELARYLAVIRQRVERNWARPPSARPGLECDVQVTQIPGGEITGVRFGSCNGDDAVRRSIEAAVLKSSPLPPPDNPALFDRNLRFTFKPQQ